MSEPTEQQVEAVHAKEWIRCIINAGADENVAQQAVALAALNGLFDLHRMAAAAPRQAEVASRQWQIATDIATRMVAGEPYTDNDVHQLAEAVAYLAAEERSDDGETSDQEKT